VRKAFCDFAMASLYINIIYLHIQIYTYISHCGWLSVRVLKLCVFCDCLWMVGVDVTNSHVIWCDGSDSQPIKHSNVNFSAVGIN